MGQWLIQLPVDKADDGRCQSILGEPMDVESTFVTSLLIHAILDLITGLDTL